MNMWSRSVDLRIMRFSFSSGKLPFMCFCRQGHKNIAAHERQPFQPLTCSSLSHAGCLLRLENWALFTFLHMCMFFYICAVITLTILFHSGETLCLLCYANNPNEMPPRWEMSGSINDPNGIRAIPEWNCMGWLLLPLPVFQRKPPWLRSIRRKPLEQTALGCSKADRTPSFMNQITSGCPVQGQSTNCKLSQSDQFLKTWRKENTFSSVLIFFVFCHGLICNDQ